MTRKDFTDIMVRLGRIDAGIDAVNKRLDTSNGRLAKHDEIITKLASDEMFQAGETKGSVNVWRVIAWIAIFLVAVLGLFASSGCYGIICKGH